MPRVLMLGSTISLALCLAILALWVRTRYVADDQAIFAAADGRVWEASTFSGGIEVLTVPGFSHPRIASRVAFPHRPDGKSRDVTEIILAIDNRVHPSTQGTFLGMVYRSDVATPGLIQRSMSWDRATKVLSHGLMGAILAEAPAEMVFREISLPYWLLTVITGAGALFMIVPIAHWMRRRQRRRSGRCVQCGYDLRASPAKCPECGAAIALGPVAGASER